MYHFKTSGEEHKEKHIDMKVPVLAIEDDVNASTLDDHEIEIPDTGKEGNQKYAKHVSLDEIRASKREEFECQQYAATIGLRRRNLEHSVPHCWYPT